jgi:predicted transcriptional regulator
MSDFLKTNYQQIIWLFIVAVFLIAFSLFVWWFFSRRKEKKDIKLDLDKKRKEIIFEVIKNGKELNNIEVVKLLNLRPKDARRYLFELAKERKIIIHEDINGDEVYKLKEN